ncbi:putative nad-dependent 15-hydroxyprostaglandin dehydrogenase protein [Botrytis fragariae]|uniref:Putative nad-dependent 15-hydroxyprostaglandin dehydrogenase protein n=1 Tax=Botrytis fragariae TaxID=1964551 RepID=A0A8H6AR57_9HELO|nr:putative nad-dependent 15-hydroxyprostaglandin dehydrogenase protein [Botrytis fragariae]KAF5871954.1 putative nad-dependent 15-hydroxyprostaglandin dehydrogenase protein [Botrytis fragariae]
MAMNVQSKTAIVTGAGSGINFCFAKLLLSKGCNVVIADLALRPEAEELISKYSDSSNGPKAVFLKTDVTEWAQLEKMFEVATEQFGGADIVCPGAGVYEPPFSNFWNPPGTPPSVDKTTESRYKLLDINITHPIRATQMAIEHFMKRKKPGTVIHISSIGGQIPFFPTPMYVASKHAISGFVRSLAQLEFPSPDIPKVRISAVAPGLIKTPLWTESPEKMAFIPKDNPDWVTPEFVAEAMLELIESEEYSGGTILEVGKITRKVEVFNDPGPPQKSTAVKHVPRENLEADIWASMERQYRS